MENVGATLLFRTAPIERLRASPVCHRREASKQINYLCPCRNTEGNTPSISEIPQLSPAASLPPQEIGLDCLGRRYVNGHHRAQCY